MKTSDLIDFILLSAIWGASFLFMRVGAPEFGAFALIGLRTGIAACCLLPLFLLREGKAPLITHGHR
jgi:drug/metabolite transporter (DMT)-like permease